MQQKTKIYIAAFFAFFGAGTYGFFRSFGPIENPNDLIEQPPEIAITFEIDSSTLQGRLTADQACRLPGYSFNQSSVDNYSRPVGANANNKNTLKTGDHLYYSPEDLTVEEIFDHIVPVKDNKVMLAYYNAGHSGHQQGFHLYPPVNGEIISIDTPEDFVIPANQGFILMSCKETEIYKVKTEEQVATNFPSALENLENGWILVPRLSTEIRESLQNYQEKIVSIWPQSSAGMSFSSNDRQVYQDISNEDFGNEKMMWLQVKTPTSSESNNQTDNSNNQSGNSSEEGSLDNTEGEIDTPFQPSENSTANVSAPFNMGVLGYSNNVKLFWSYPEDESAPEKFLIEYQKIDTEEYKSLEVDYRAGINYYEVILNSIFSLEIDPVTYLFRVKSIYADGNESDFTQYNFPLRSLPTIDDVALIGDSDGKIKIDLIFDEIPEEFNELSLNNFKVSLFKIDINSGLKNELVINHNGIQKEISTSREELGLDRGPHTLLIEVTNTYNKGKSPLFSKSFLLGEQI